MQKLEVIHLKYYIDFIWNSKLIYVYDLCVDLPDYAFYIDLTNCKWETLLD